MRKTPVLRRTVTRRRYQRGSIKDDGDRWILRYRTDERLPAGTPLCKNDKLLSAGEVLHRKHTQEYISKKSWPTEELAREELKNIIAKASRKALVLPPELHTFEVVLCKGCRERLLVALSNRQPQ